MAFSLARSSIVGLVIVCAALSVSCKKKGDVLGSCERSAHDDYSIGSVRQCTDAIAESVLNVCTKPNEKKVSSACKRDGAIAGCKESDQIRWYYNDGAGSATVDTVGRYCVQIAKGTTVLPDGNPAPVKNAEQLEADTLKGYVAEHGAKAKAALATVASIGAKLPAPTGKLDLQGLKGDVLLVHREDLGDIENPKKIPYRLEDAGTLAACSRILNNRKSATDQGSTLRACGTSPLIAILSVSKHTGATLVGQSESANMKTNFVKKGKIISDLLFFRADNGKYLGSYGVAAENVTVTGTPEQLTKELMESFAVALFTKTKSAAPGVSLLFRLAKN